MWATKTAAESKSLDENAILSMTGISMNNCIKYKRGQEARRWVGLDSSQPWSLSLIGKVWVMCLLSSSNILAPCRRGHFRCLGTALREGFWCIVTSNLGLLSASSSMYMYTWPCTFVFLVMWVPMELLISEVFTAYTAVVDQIHPHCCPGSLLPNNYFDMCNTLLAPKDA